MTPKSLTVLDIFMTLPLISMRNSSSSFIPKKSSWNFSRFATISFSLNQFIAILISFSIHLATTSKVLPHAKIVLL